MKLEAVCRKFITWLTILKVVSRMVLIGITDLGLACGLVLYPEVVVFAVMLALASMALYLLR